MEGKDRAVERKNHYEKSQTQSKSIQEKAEKNLLSLRKETIGNAISTHRGLDKIRDENEHLKIKPKDLHLSPSSKLCPPISVDKILSYLTSPELNIKKFGIYHLNNYISNKSDDTLIEVVANDVLHELQKILHIYYLDDSIVYEILQIYLVFLKKMPIEEIQNFCFSGKNLRCYEIILEKHKSFNIAKIPEIIQLTVVGNDLCYEALYKSNFMLKLLDLLSNEIIYMDLQIEAAYLFVHLSHDGFREVESAKTYNKILSVIKKNLSIENELIREDSLRTLCNITLKGGYGNVLLMKEGIQQDVVNLLEISTNALDIELSMIVIGNLIVNGESNVDNLLSNGILKIFSNLIKHELPQVRRKVGWCISNIAAGTVDHINALITSKTSDQILACLNDASDHVITEALNALVNILSDCKVEICQIFVDIGMIEEIINVITRKSNPVVLNTALLTLQKLFTLGELLIQSNKNRANPYAHQFSLLGGVDKIEKLQEHENIDVYKLSLDILEKFFETK